LVACVCSAKMDNEAGLKAKYGYSVAGIQEGKITLKSSFGPIKGYNFD